MPFARYEPDLEAWKEHFKNTESDKKIVPLKSSKKNTQTPIQHVQVKLVTPTEQAVKQAKELVKTQAKRPRKTAHPFENER